MTTCFAVSKIVLRLWMRKRRKTWNHGTQIVAIHLPYLLCFKKKTISPGLNWNRERFNTSTCASKCLCERQIQIVQFFFNRHLIFGIISKGTTPAIPNLCSRTKTWFAKYFFLYLQPTFITAFGTLPFYFHLLFNITSRYNITYICYYLLYDWVLGKANAIWTNKLTCISVGRIDSNLHNSCT